MQHARPTALLACLLLAAGCASSEDPPPSAEAPGPAAPAAPEKRPPSPAEVLRRYCEAASRGAEGLEQSLEAFTPRAARGYRLLARLEPRELRPWTGYTLGAATVEDGEARVKAAIARRSVEEERTETYVFHLRRREDGSWRIYAWQREGSDAIEDFEAMAGELERREREE